MSTDNQHYFILTKKPGGYLSKSPGQICYMSVHKYTSQLSSNAVSHYSSHKLPVIFVDAYSSLDYDIEVSCLEDLGLEEAELLQSLPDDAERLKWFTEGDALRRALGLKEGTDVIVDKDGEKLRGVIRYIGRLKEPSTLSCPLSGRFFGIELQGLDKGKGNTNGIYRGTYKQLFSCPKDCGIFVPFTRLRPVAPSSLSPSVPEPSAQPETKLAPGDRVTYFINDKDRHGMVLDVLERNGKYFVRISTDRDENGKTGGEVEFPLQSVFKEEVPSEPERMDIDTPPLEQSVDNHFLDINSLVEVTLGEGNSYGIIRWIGTLPERKDIMAGLELEEDKGVSDGTFKSQRFFDCPPKRALFVKLASCRPDSRFQSPTASRGESMLKQLDTEPQDAPIQNTLLHDIVNPLRINGFVEGRHIMKLRQQLQKHGYSHSFTTDEKDPEEFLTVIMHHILALDPLLKLSAAGKVQESYCYQIFLDQEHSLVLPTVQQLLEHSFYSSGLKLAEVPSCLILQMPRFGKKFKMFDKIIPSLELDVTDLLSEGPQQCVLCGNLAEEECTACFKDPVFSQTGFKVFCGTCSSQIHAHPQRQSHQRAPLKIPKGYAGRSNPPALTRDKLELFAVLCIETSHYVSFIKYGPNSQDWIFFDSMADRQGEQFSMPCHISRTISVTVLFGSSFALYLGERDGYNIPEVHACPEVGTYLEMSQAELAAQVPRDMKGVAKRLFCDAYMYLYQSTSMCLYR
ncbi:Ubiquitin carboxyl-terminal hydrolase CYLD [Larimichthys crocea]|uniref:Uncharacterized protein n=1 Tax=Larimichthys crocea TaxID=215358 RepID=A0ACD3RL68_LARCR|nr:Ubiquitin carboxyl-terminal hydrolase CYLD [Larimichthys crocea]